MPNANLTNFSVKIGKKKISFFRFFGFFVIFFFFISVPKVFRNHGNATATLTVPAKKMKRIAKNINVKTGNSIAETANVSSNLGLVTATKIAPVEPTKPIALQLKTKRILRRFSLHLFSLTPPNATNGLSAAITANVFPTGGNAMALKIVVTKATNWNVKMSRRRMMMIIIMMMKTTIMSITIPLGNPNVPRTSFCVREATIVFGKLGFVITKTTVLEVKTKRRKSALIDQYAQEKCSAAKSPAIAFPTNRFVIKRWIAPMAPMKLVVMIPSLTNIIVVLMSSLVMKTIASLTPRFVMASVSAWTVPMNWYVTMIIHKYLGWKLWKTQSMLPLFSWIGTCRIWPMLETMSTNQDLLHMEPKNGIGMPGKRSRRPPGKSSS